ncbi:hypothetical protein [Phormidium nigroviride]
MIFTLILLDRQQYQTAAFRHHINSSCTGMMGSGKWGMGSKQRGMENY